MGNSSSVEATVATVWDVPTGIKDPLGGPAALLRQTPWVVCCSLPCDCHLDIFSLCFFTTAH